ncbi:hypothetical protein OMK64_06705 [Cellulomonas fimi]|uniref:hypothetical protein n=1 Tax=Cellulomonas fimi TaxID=1708 RepID=UPI00234C5AE5|nr:hypothetical protein [Cellulomonas fimi]MDC7121222.1 hypothetical protein [Cellulomonas fimi]
MDAVARWTGIVAGDAQCEAADGPVTEPVAAVTSLAFVVGALVVLLVARRTDPAGAGVRRVGTYAALVAATGVGSAVEHGPDPAWSDVAHDFPLLATLAFLVADAAADLGGRTRVWWWWALPAGGLVPVVVLAPRAGDLAQVGVAVAAVGLTVLRARARPPLRPSVTLALALLVVGAAVGTMSRPGLPWCDPSTPWQGHGVWHVLAAAALVVLGSTVGRVGFGAGVSAAAPVRSRARARARGRARA